MGCRFLCSVDGRDLWGIRTDGRFLIRFWIRQSGFTVLCWRANRGGCDCCPLKKVAENIGFLVSL